MRAFYVGVLLTYICIINDVNEQQKPDWYARDPDSTFIYDLGNGLDVQDVYLKLNEAGKWIFGYYGCD